MTDCNDNKELLCNLSLIKALVHFVPVSDQRKIQEWVAKFQENDGVSDNKIKNEYSFYLLINMLNGTLMQPFNKCPPSEKLKPLCRILPDYLYEDVQNQFKINYCRLSRILNASSDNYEMPDLRCEPSGFHSEQPRPRKGVTASFTVFSNYDDEDN